MLFSRRKRRITRVLIVEDEPLVAFDAEHLLSEAGYAVVATVDTVSAALVHLDNDDPHLVLLDINLSDGTGLAIAERAQQLGVPVLIVAGLCPDQARVAAVGWLAKPYRPRDLTGAIGVIEAIGSGRSPRSVPERLSIFAAVG
ncbi:response regulator [Sphingomonas sp. CJ99]